MGSMVGNTPSQNKHERSANSTSLNLTNSQDKLKRFNFLFMKLKAQLYIALQCKMQNSPAYGGVVPLPLGSENDCPWAVKMTALGQ